MVNYQNKNVAIIGATGGLGEVLCKNLAEQGAKLSISSTNAEKLNALAAELSKTAEVFAQVVDVTKEEDVAAFFTKSFETFGEIHATVNLAGLSIPAKISEMAVEDYEKMMDVNVKGTFLAGKHFAKYAAKPAILINIGSTAAKTANPNAPIYCTSKAAVNMMSQGMLLQMGSQDIRVTTINPGGIDTPFWGTRKVDRTKLMCAEDVVDVIMFALMSSPRIQIHDIYFESSARFN